MSTKDTKNILQFKIAEIVQKEMSIHFIKLLLMRFYVWNVSYISDSKLISTVWLEDDYDFIDLL